MSAWHTLRVASVAPAADGLTEFSLDLRGTPLAGTHRIPGQYVHLALPGLEDKAPFAIASPPQVGHVHWDFLLKTGRPLPEALALLSPGAEVLAGEPEGRGFPLERAHGRNLLLFATGSGISPIRSVIESVRLERAAYRKVTLYFGARTPTAFAYSNDFAHWEAAGIRVVRTVSQPGASGWQGLTGYVQAHLGEEPLGPCMAFVCGQGSMVQGVMSTLAERGIARDDISLNY